MATFPKAAIEKFGKTMRSKYQSYVLDRQEVEQQWLKDIYQYKGKYDPEVEKNIPLNRSKVYPRDTHTKVNGFVAKMMEMMFPASDKNWSVTRTPTPNLTEEDVTQIIKRMQAEKMAAQQAQQEQMQAQGQPMQPIQPAPLNPKDLELRIKQVAEERAVNMERECEDQLADIGGERIEYAQICKKAIRSGGIYGVGVVKGPQVRSQEETAWSIDLTETNVVQRPYYENVRVWDIYPDLSARSWYEMEGLFERIVLSRHGLRKLADEVVRPDFDSGAIKDYLRAHQAGNYKALTYESTLNTLKQISNVAQRDTRKYEVIRWFGYVSGHELRSAGVDVTEGQLDADVLADVWLLDDVVIKAEVAPFGDMPADMYHAFILEEDEDSPLTGTGLPCTLRDSQMRLCAVDRATMDNMSASAGPITELNVDLIEPGQDIQDIHSFMTIQRAGRGVEANTRAVHSVDIPSHVPELVNLRQTLTQIMDVESGLPQWLFGDARPLGEAFRTSNNMSMMQGGANMLTKDIVRAFDRFTVSLIGSLVKWNMEFNPKPQIKGDSQVQPKGTTSLVAKEMRGAALDQFWSTLAPDERVMLDSYAILTERMKARDLPLDALKDREQAAEAVAQFQQAQAQAQGIQDGLVQAQTQKFGASAQKDMAQAQEIAAQNEVKIQKMLSEIEHNMTSAKGLKDRGQLEYIKTLLEQLQTGTGAKPAQNVDAIQNTGAVENNA